ncbi:hypothetical protein HK405_005741, partial [Cladochytrium tenue]
MAPPQPPPPPPQLPPELLVHLLTVGNGGGLSACDQLCSAACVSRAWHRAAVEACHTLTIPATSTVLTAHLARILERLPRLRNLRLVAVADDGPAAGGARPAGGVGGDPAVSPEPWSGAAGSSRLEALAAQFTGHAFLEELRCASDRVVAAAVAGCPRLQVLVLEYPRQSPAASSLIPPAPASEVSVRWPWGTTVAGGAAIWPDRDVPGILARIGAAGGKLRVLEVQAPTAGLDTVVVAGTSGKDSGSSHFRQIGLKRLRIGSVAGEALETMVEWLMSAPTALENLREFVLDADYLHLPPATVSALANASPHLELLKLKYAYLSPAHAPQIAAWMGNTLRTLSIGKCDVWFYASSRRWRRRSVGGGVPHVRPLTVVDGGGGANTGEGAPADNNDDAQVSVAELVLYLTARLPHLASLHLSECQLLVLPASHGALSADTDDGEIGCRTALRSLKVFGAPGAVPPAQDDVEVLVAAHPGLRSIRMDVPAGLASAGGLARVVQLLPGGLDVLELRSVGQARRARGVGVTGAGAGDNTEQPAMADSAAPQGEDGDKRWFMGLRDMAMWSARASAVRLVLLGVPSEPTTMRVLTKLERLSLNYVLDVDGEIAAAVLGGDSSGPGVAPWLPRLRRLELRFVPAAALIGTGGCDLARALLRLCTLRAPGLRELVVEATGFLGSGLGIAGGGVAGDGSDEDEWVALAGRCRQLRVVELVGVELGRGVVGEGARRGVLSKVETLRAGLCVDGKVWAAGRTADVDAWMAFVCAELGPFVEARRRLRELHVTFVEDEEGGGRGGDDTDTGSESEAGVESEEG